MVDGREHLLAIADVGDECRCLRPYFGDLVGDGVDAVGPHVDECDVRTVAGQPQGDAAADPAAPAGDECDLSLEAHVSPSDGGVDEDFHLLAGVQRLEPLVDDVVDGDRRPSRWCRSCPSP